MHDIKAIRDEPDLYLQGWEKRGVSDASQQVGEILRLDGQLRAAQTSFQAAQAKRNELSKQIGQAKAQKDEPRAQALMAEVEALKGELDRHYAVEGEVGPRLKDILARLPNIPAPEVPDGEDETGNVEVGRWSDRAKVPAGRLNATPKDHVELGEALGMMDFEAAARMSGARFVVLKKDLARLERAIGQFMLDLQTTENGYMEVSPPILVNNDAMFGTGQLPKFAEDSFQVGHRIDLDSDAYFRGNVFAEAKYDFHLKKRELILGLNQIQHIEQNQSVDAMEVQEYLMRALEKNRANIEILHALDGLQRFFQEYLNLPHHRGHYLIPTAEVSLTNLVREEITDEAELPMRLTALTPCFRSEAGASGRDTRGMIRQHQFWKCELVCISTPENSAAEHDHMVASAQMVLERLELPYRTMLLCAGDMGFTAKKTFDLEVWLPSQNTYREISSVSNCGDFQARRMDARIKKAGEKGTRFPHTLNGSGLAVGRTLVAILENYQDEGGRIAIPSALQPYMGGLTHIGAAR